MNKYIITYGSRASDVVTIEVSDITNASEVYNAAYAILKDRQLAFAVLEAIDNGNFQTA